MRLGINSRLSYHHTPDADPPASRQPAGPILGDDIPRRWWSRAHTKKSRAMQASLLIPALAWPQASVGLGKACFSMGPHIHTHTFQLYGFTITELRDPMG